MFGNVMGAEHGFHHGPVYCDRRENLLSDGRDPPVLVVKSGFIAWAAMDDPNASIPTPQPMFGHLK